jgi:hypothetical protein
VGGGLLLKDGGSACAEYRVCEEREKLPAIIQRYFETFRIEAPAGRDQNAPFSATKSRG